MGWLITGRSLLGLATVVAVSLHAGHRDPLTALSEEGLKKMVYSVGLALCLVPVSIVLLFLLTKRRYRKELAWRPVFRQMGLMVGTAGPLIYCCYRFLTYDPEGVAHNYLLMVVSPLAIGMNFLLARKCMAIKFAVIVAFLLCPFSATLLMFAPLFWMAAYLFCVAFWANRTSCWIGLFHPLLAPALSAVVVTTFTVISLIDVDTKGVSVNLWLWLTYGGLASALALATAEWVRLRRQGYATATDRGPSLAPV